MLRKNYNYNFENDDYFYDQNLASPHNTKIYQNCAPDNEYLRYCDLGDSYLMKQFNTESRIDECAAVSMVNVNSFNMNSYYDETDKSDAWHHGSNNENFNASKLTGSDDEALEDYLNSLAKNCDEMENMKHYDERFVNQINESEPSELLNTKAEESKTNYVTELRVNIANSVRKNIINPQEGHRPRFRSTRRQLRDINSPAVRKRSSLSVTYKLDERKNMSQSQHINSDLISKCKNSGNTVTDFEQVLIPPPKLFCSYYENICGLCHNKEVQATDFTEQYNTIVDTTCEDRGIQTLCQINSLLKPTVDAGVGTETPLPRETPKITSGKCPKNSKTVSLDSFDLSESENQSASNDSSGTKIEQNHPLPSSNKGKNEIDIRSNSVKLSEYYDQNENPTLRNHRDKKISKNYSTTKSKNTAPMPNKTDFPQELFDLKDGTKNASSEIQRLLENLGNRLKATMCNKESKHSTKPKMNDEFSIASFWDNPLLKKDPITSKKSPSHTLRSNALTKSKKTCNIINSELQAICRTIEKNIKKDKNSKCLPQSTESKSEVSECVQINKNGFQNDSIDVRSSMRNVSPNQSNEMNISSVPNNNLTGDGLLLCNNILFKSFDLNPYDDIVKSHLSPIDRRLKSVAAKNGCTIVISGPLNAYDSSSTTQAFRNKVMYRCTITGQCKENLNKCINYLKETFPNTFLKTNSRT